MSAHTTASVLASHTRMSREPVDDYPLAHIKARPVLDVDRMAAALADALNLIADYEHDIDLATGAHIKAEEELSRLRPIVDAAREYILCRGELYGNMAWVRLSDAIHKADAVRTADTTHHQPTQRDDAHTCAVQRGGE